MLFGLPIELITMLGSTMLSGVMTLWGQSVKAKNEQFNNLIKAQSKQYENQIEQIKADPGFSFTRRVLAFLIAGAAVAAIFVPTLLGGTSLIEVTSSTEGLFGLFSDSSTEFVETQALVVPEWLKHAMLSIVGLYFGNSIVKK